MALQIIVGAQWGDEGKGRIVDWFAAGADITARYNGGDNAGHTVTVGKKIFKLHLIPSGIIHPQIIAVMGNGMVINPQRLFEEMDSLQAAGIDVSPARMRISYAAHIITPAHQALDHAQEAARGKGNIGTTGRGIGPAYTDKAIRRGLRMSNLLSVDFSEQLAAHLESANDSLKALGAPPLEIAPILNEFANYALRLEPYITDTAIELDAAHRAGKIILAEGAQGTLLDIDHGTYPFVTSSSTVASAALTGLGLGMIAACDARVTGVVKAFQTRVGSGPFPTEVGGELAQRLRGTGANPWDEYGTTTGRPRRVGWLDGVLLRYAARLNGFTELAITKLDIFSGFDTLRVCTAYHRGNQTLREPQGGALTDLPAGPADLSLFEPVYVEMPGWAEDVSGARKWGDLPRAAKKYLELVANLAGAPLRLVSVGPEREQVISRKL
jgi:adenylosuccinate synthase